MSCDDLETEIARLESVIRRAKHLLAVLDTNDESDDELHDAVVIAIETRQDQLSDCEEALGELLAPEYEATAREGWEAYCSR